MVRLEFQRTNSGGRRGDGLEGDYWRQETNQEAATLVVRDDEGLT